MYGAVDLMVVGKFGSAADISAVSTGAQVMTTLTTVIVGLSMGTTILLGRQIGEKKTKDAGRTIGASIYLFMILGLILTILMQFAAPAAVRLMKAPEEAFSRTVAYVRICSGGALFIVAFNILGSVFRGIGNSKMPLVAVAIACVTNIFGDLLLVAVFPLGTAGAAIATVFAQALSVALSVIIIRKQSLPFEFRLSMVRGDGELIRRVTQLGLPIAFQDLLVSISFLVITAIVNSLGLIASAGVGVAEKICGFIMLVPSAFMQSMSAFVAQNFGAHKMDRAYKALRAGIVTSLTFGVIMGYFAFFHGRVLAFAFAKDPEVISAAAAYLKAYAIDCLLVSFLFCFIGFYNGLGRTKFVMLQGIAGSFGVRIPVSFFMSRIRPVSLFMIGLATPCSTSVQIILCFIMLAVVKKAEQKS